MSTRMHVSFWIGVFVCSDIYPRVELLGHIVGLFLVFLRNLHTLFHSSCTNYIPPRNIQELLFLQILAPIFYLCSLELDMSDWTELSDKCEVYLIVVLICISLMIRNVEYLFMCLLIICISLEKCLLRFSAHFKNWFVWFFLILSCKSCLYILDINSLLVISFANVFPIQ